MKWLKRFFRRLVSAPAPVANDFGSGEELKYSWGYIVPHTAKAAGAVGYRGLQKFSEYQYGLEVAEINRVFLPFETRDNGGVLAAALKLKAKGANASIEAHLNAFNGKVGGAEILVLDGDAESYDMAQNLLAAFALEFPNFNIRGVKRRKSGDTGYFNLMQAKAAGMRIALLTEFFFIDSEYIAPEAMAAFIRKNLVK
jgi:hypothetical protein